jgi:MYXO-CTERM domain-containing protein
MRLSTVRRSLTLLASGGVALLSAGSVLAQEECAADADCAAGFVCEVVGVSGCAAPACEPGVDCDMVPMTCESEEFYGCVPAPCSTDADCGAGMVCEVTVTDCSTVSQSCDRDGNCTETMSAPCETSDAQCVYQWQTACEADADCGAGFTCVEAPESCACSGAPAEPAMEMPAMMVPEGVDGGAAPIGAIDQPLPPDDCSCEPSGAFYCQADEIECDSNVDCPESWTCESAPQADCAGQGGDSTDPGMAQPPADAPAEFPVLPAVDAGAAEPVDEDPPEEDDNTAADPLPAEPLVEEEKPVVCEPVAAKSMCVPPGGYYGGPAVPDGTPVMGEEGGGTVDNGGEPPTTSEPPREDPQIEPTDPAGPSNEGDTAAEEEPGDDDAPAGEETDESSDEEDDGAQNNAVDDDGDSGDDGSCAVQAPGAGSGAGYWLLSLLGLAFLRRRRA